jgi:hypothetical protein
VAARNVAAPCRSQVILGWAGEAGDFPDKNSLPWVSFLRRAHSQACLSHGSAPPAPPRQDGQSQDVRSSQGEGGAGGSTDESYFLIRTVEEHSASLQGHHKLPTTCQTPPSSRGCQPLPLALQSPLAPPASPVVWPVKSFLVNWGSCSDWAEDRAVSPSVWGLPEDRVLSPPSVWDSLKEGPGLSQPCFLAQWEKVNQDSGSQGSSADYGILTSIDTTF